jgi:hypothetical protein
MAVTSGVRVIASADQANQDYLRQMRMGGCGQRQPDQEAVSPWPYRFVCETDPTTKGGWH